MSAHGDIVEKFGVSAKERREADRALEDFLVDRRLNERRYPSGPHSAHDYSIAEALAAYTAEHGPKVKAQLTKSHTSKPSREFSPATARRELGVLQATVNPLLDEICAPTSKRHRSHTIHGHMASA